MKKKIYIDAGHGGDSIGASYKGRLEQDDTLKLSLAVGRLLKIQPNIEVKYSRTGNTNPDLTGRCNEANAWGADYFISIHRDAFKPNAATGASVWVYSGVTPGGETYNKAKNILENICESYLFGNRAVHLGAASYKDYAVNRVTKMHSCLLEVGFIDNDTDNKIFDEFFDRIAFGIAKGLCEAVGERFYPLGDINLDGMVDAADARFALRAAVGLYTVKENAVAMGDINGDGTITEADAREILRKTVGLEEKENV